MSKNIFRCLSFRERDLSGLDKNIKILHSWSIMFGLVELEFRLDGGGCNLNLVWVILVCIPKIGFVTCLEVP